MSNASTLLARIHARGIRTEIENGDLRLRGLQGKITPKLVKLVRRHKHALIEILTPDVRDQQRIIPAAASRCDPHELLREPIDHPNQLTVQFGDENLPFNIWDGEELRGRYLGIDTETHLINDPDIPRLVLASASNGRDHYVIARDRITEFLQLHRDRHFVAHNMRFDFAVLQNWLGGVAAINTKTTGNNDFWQPSLLWEIADRGQLHCSDVLEQLIRLAKFDDPPRLHSLDKLAKHYLHVELFGKDDPRRTGFADIDGQPLAEVPEWYLQYAVQDAIAAVRIHARQRRIAKQLQPDAADLLPNARKRYGLLTEKLQVKAGIVLDGIYRTGMHLDPDKIAPARESLREEVFALAEELDQYSTEDRPLLQRYKQQRFITEENRGFKTNNKTETPQKHEDHIRDVFADIAKDHKLDPPESTEGKLSLTRDFWEEHRDHPVVDRFLDLQGKAKTLSFFFDLNGHCIRSRYNPIVRSGRVSCKEPNLQQMPRAGNVREMFVGSPGHVLFTIDFNALELATLGAVCLQKYGESKLAEVINSGKDAHAYSYCKIHEMTEKEFNEWKASDPEAAKAARDAIKGVTFGVPGSMQPEGLVRYVKKAYGQEISLETAKEYREKLIHEVYPEWRKYLAQTGSRVSTLTGRVRGKIERSGQLFNTQFQGLAGDGAKSCLWQLMRAGYRLVGFVHDEFLIELPEAGDHTEAAEAINRICCETMEEFTPGVRISCEYAVSRCWSKRAEEVRDDQGRLIPWEPGVIETKRTSPRSEYPESPVVADLLPSRPITPAKSVRSNGSVSTGKLVKPLNYHGGKDYLASRIIGLMPEHTHYVEPFAGGLSVLFRKDPHGVSEVVNDLNGQLMNFYQVLQDPNLFDQFYRRVEVTPFSQVEFEQASQDGSSDPVEAAAIFFVLMRQSRQGIGRDFATLSRNRTRRGMNEQASAWLAAVAGLPQIHARLRRVVICNTDAVRLIKQQDGPKTLFYCDPPYLIETRSSTGEYQHGMTTEQHQELIEVLAGIKGKFLLSGYPSKLYSECARQHAWRCNRFQIDNKASSAKVKEKKTECVWMNFGTGGGR